MWVQMTKVWCRGRWQGQRSNDSSEPPAFKDYRGIHSLLIGDSADPQRTSRERLRCKGPNVLTEGHLVAQDLYLRLTLCTNHKNVAFNGLYGNPIRPLAAKL